MRRCGNSWCMRKGRSSARGAVCWFDSTLHTFRRLERHGQSNLESNLPGMWMSMRMRSGRRASAASSASAPLPTISKEAPGTTRCRKREAVGIEGDVGDVARTAYATASCRDAWRHPTCGAVDGCKPFSLAAHLQDLADHHLIHEVVLSNQDAQRLRGGLSGLSGRARCRRRRRLLLWCGRPLCPGSKGAAWHGRLLLDGGQAAGCLHAAALALPCRVVRHDGRQLRLPAACPARVPVHATPWQGRQGRSGRRGTRTAAVGKHAAGHWLERTATIRRCGASSGGGGGGCRCRGGCVPAPAVEGRVVQRYAAVDCQAVQAGAVGHGIHDGGVRVQRRLLLGAREGGGLEQRGHQARVAHRLAAEGAEGEGGEGGVQQGAKGACRREISAGQELAGSACTCVAGCTQSALKLRSELGACWGRSLASLPHGAAGPAPDGGGQRLQVEGQVLPPPQHHQRAPAPAASHRCMGQQQMRGTVVSRAGISPSQPRRWFKPDAPAQAHAAAAPAHPLAPCRRW